MTQTPGISNGLAVVIFVKTPGLSPVKTRLAETIGRENAVRFYQNSCAAMASVVRQFASTRTDGTWAVTPYWAVAEASGLKNPAWKDFDRVSQGDGGLGHRLSRVYNELMGQHRGVLFLGADSPQLTLELLDRALQLLTGSERFVLGPAEDGGFYLFAGNRPVEESVWTGVPYGDWQTCELLSKGLSAIAPVKKLPPLFDVDTQDDLIRLRKLLGSRKDLLPEQKNLYTWLKDSSFTA